MAERQEQEQQRVSPSIMAELEEMCNDPAFAPVYIPTSNPGLSTQTVIRSKSSIITRSRVSIVDIDRIENQGHLIWLIIDRVNEVTLNIINRIHWSKVMEGIPSFQERTKLFS